MDLLNKLNETADYIKGRCSLVPSVGITLGSGLAHFAEEVDVDTLIPFNEIPHFTPPSVEGHPGALLLGKIRGKNVAVLQGRIHFYEGHSLDSVVYPTRVLKFLGIDTLILTNAAGGIAPNMAPGDLMLISDHINLTGNNPLIGPNIKELGARFPDMTNTYSPELLEKAESIMKTQNISYKKGVYCGVTGPSYETPAEVQYLHKIGGSAVGMSTVPEAICARHMGLKIAGISCVTNLAAGISKTELNHDEVKEVAQRVEKEFCAFLSEFIENL